jgi:hypothetical protein
MMKRKIMKSMLNQLSKACLLAALACAGVCSGATSKAVAQGGAPPAATISRPDAERQKDSQESDASTVLREPPLTCETFFSHLDDAIIKWKDTKGSYLIVISRLGNAERARGLTVSRLGLVKDYLQGHKVNFVTAEGSRTRGLGQIELYVGGKLLTIISVRKNARTPCDGSTG